MGAGSGDINLDVELQVASNVSLDTLKQQLQSISALVKEPFKLKVEVDRGDLTTLKKEMTSIKKSYERLVLKPGTGGTGSKSTVGYINKDSNNYLSTIKKINAEISKGESLKTQLKGLGTKEAKAQIKSLSVSLDKLYATRKNLESGEGVQSDEFTKQLNKYGGIIDNVSTKTKSLINDQKALKKAMANVDTPLKSGDKGYTKYVESLNKTYSGIEKYASTVGKNDVVKNSKQYSDYVNQLNTIKDLQDKLSSGNMGAKKFGSQYQSALENISNCKRELASLVTEQKKASGQKFVETGTEQFYKDLKKLDSLQNRINSQSAKIKGIDIGDNENLKEANKDLKQYAQSVEDLRQKLQSGQMGQTEFNNEFAKLSYGLDKIDSEVDNVNQKTGLLTAGLKGAASELSQFAAQYLTLRQAIQTVKEMASASMEIEDAMAQIKIVTGATDSQMTQFFETSKVMAQDLGKSISEVASSVETFSRLGYNISEASDLSKFATILSNVGNTSVEDATTGMTSIIKSYSMEPSDAEHVADVLVEVGQKYAISAEELMAAYERGGAALSATGTSFEQSAGLFAAANASLQNAEKVGTMFNTVSARIDRNGQFLDSVTNRCKLGEPINIGCGLCC